MQLLSEDGTLLRRDVLEQFSQFSLSTRGGRHGHTTNRLSPWDAIPSALPGTFDRSYDLFSSNEVETSSAAKDAAVHIERFFAKLNESAPLPAIERMLRGAEVEPAGATTSSTGRPIDQFPFLSATLTSSETVATVAIVDADNRTRQGRQGGVSLCPTHVLQSYLDDFVSEDNPFHQGTQSPMATFAAAASPRRRGVHMTTPAYSSTPSCSSDRVIGFDVASLTQKVVTVMAPMISHWIVVGDRESCRSTLSFLSRTLVALRASGSPVCSTASVDVSLVVTTDSNSNGSSRTEEADFLNLCSAITASSPMIVVATGSEVASPGQRNYNANELNHNRLLASLRACMLRTRPLYYEESRSRHGSVQKAQPVSVPLLAQLLVLSCCYSPLQASDAIVAYCQDVSVEFFRYVTCESLQILARSALLANRYSSLDDVTAVIRRAARYFFSELCGALSPSPEVFESLERRVESTSRSISQDLKAEAFHIAQNSIAAAMSPLSAQLTPSNTDPVQWISEFRVLATKFISEPLLSATVGQQRNESVVQLTDHENLLTRQWASAAKKSALTDVVMQWQLPNTEVLMYTSAESFKIQCHHKDEAIRSAHLRIADLESRIAESEHHCDKLSGQANHLHAVADSLQANQNTLKAHLSQLSLDASKNIEELSRRRIRRRFVEENTVSTSRDDVNSNDSGDEEHSHVDGSYAEDAKMLEQMMRVALERVSECLRLLESPTHGLLVSMDGPELNGLGKRSTQHTPDISFVTDRKSAVNMSVRSAAGSLTSDVQAARKASARENNNNDKRTVGIYTPATSQPPSPISPTIHGGHFIGFPDATRVAPQAPPLNGDAELARQEERVVTSMNAVAELQQRAASLREQFLSAKSYAQEVEGKLRDAMLELSACRDELAVKEDRVHAALAAHEDSMAQLASERSAHSATREQLELRKDELRHLQGLLDATTLHLQQTEATLERIKADDDKQIASLGSQLGALQSNMSEMKKRCELITIDSSMHESNAKQYHADLLQLEKVLSQERQQHRDAAYSHDQRMQEVMQKLEETVKRYERTLHDVAEASSERIESLNEELHSCTQEKKIAMEKAVMLTEELQQHSKDSTDTRETCMQLERSLTQIKGQYEALTEQHRVLEIRFLTTQEELRTRDSQLAGCREELRQSKEARRMLCHSMETLEMFIQEQKELGGGDGGSRGVTSAYLDDLNPHALLSEHRTFPHQPAPLPPAMSVIRAVAAESISRDDPQNQSTTPPPAVTSASSFVPLRSHNTSTMSAAPINLSQLMRDNNESREATPSSYTPQFHYRDPVPLQMPAAPRNSSSGPRPLGPHLQALAAIDSLLH